ncbi:MAG: efflux RND transporter periplasmic adaptor subunit [Prevotella sp.]|nr:efflux RND transporter periplasmic adaptor subunit [Prevotella sp.]
MRIKFLGIVFAALGVLTACSGGKDVSYSTAKVTRQSISTSITATGTIEPVTEVEVGTQVSGIIDKIYVDYNSVVKKGEIIAELDKTNLVSELASAQSNLNSAESSLAYEKTNYSRYKTLYDKGLVSADDFENARLSYEKAVEQVNIEKQTVEKARTNLGYATITAPIDGVVLSKEVEEGQTVASSMTTPTLFIIAQDLTDMRVIADVDEADIGGVVEGQRVSFTVDAFPDDTFNGEVTQVRQEATTESNVVTYEVVISAPNEDLKLKPGLTANVTIYTLEKDDVLAVAAKALRFSPSEALLQEGETIEDAEGQHKLWVREGKVFKAYPVEVGTTNGTITEILSGVDEGTVVLTDFSVAADEEDSSEEETSNPFMPSPPGKKKSNSSSSNSGNSASEGEGNSKSEGGEGGSAK